jgi:hypothetical protein
VTESEQDRRNDAFDKKDEARAKRSDEHVAALHVEHNYLVKIIKRITWTFFIAFLGIFVGVGFNIWYTNHVNNERIRTQQAQSEEGRKVFCSLVNSQIRVYQETPPTTPTGKNSQQSWIDLGKLLRCEEAK